MSGVLVRAAIEGAHRSRGEPSGSDSTRWLSFAPTSTMIEYGPERSRGLERRHRGHWLVLSRGAAAERARSPSTSALAAWSRRWPTLARQAAPCIPTASRRASTASSTAPASGASDYTTSNLKKPHLAYPSDWSSPAW